MQNPTKKPISFNTLIQLMIMFDSTLPNREIKDKKEQEKWRSEESNKATTQPKRKRFHTDFVRGLFNEFLHLVNLPLSVTGTSAIRCYVQLLALNLAPY